MTQIYVFPLLLCTCIYTATMVRTSEHPVQFEVRVGVDSNDWLGALFTDCKVSLAWMNLQQ